MERDLLKIIFLGFWNFEEFISNVIFLLYMYKVIYVCSDLKCLKVFIWKLKGIIYIGLYVFNKKIGILWLMILLDFCYL